MLAETISEKFGEWATTLVVDSMQVYREVPLLTNQGRTRAAEMVGIVSVADEWTVAHHKDRSESIISSLSADLPFVLDAGTGMYLNAILLDIPLAPKAPAEVQAKAANLAVNATNPRREARRLELDLTGTPERGSIWGTRKSQMIYDATFLYLRPERSELDRNIAVRSSRISRDGLWEAKRLIGSGTLPNPSARTAIGIKEMLLVASGELHSNQAEEQIAIRTRRLARRQIRWFDKLIRNLPDTTPHIILDTPKAANDPHIKHIVHDILEG